MVSSKIIEFLDPFPEELKLAFLIMLFVFSGFSVYAGINMNFGAKVHSRIPKENLWADFSHIIRYKVALVIIFIFFFVTNS